MATITINGLDEQVVTQISERARSNRHTIEQEAAELLKRGLGMRPKSSVPIELAEKIAAMTPKDVKQTDSVELLREDRSR